MKTFFPLFLLWLLAIWLFESVLGAFSDYASALALRIAAAFILSMITKAFMAQDDKIHGLEARVKALEEKENPET